MLCEGCLFPINSRLCCGSVLPCFLLWYSLAFCVPLTHLGIVQVLQVVGVVLRYWLFSITYSFFYGLFVR